MTLKSHYALYYANRAVLWLNGTSYGVGDGTARYGDDEFYIGCQYLIVIVFLYMQRFGCNF